MVKYQPNYFDNALIEFDAIGSGFFWGMMGQIPVAAGTGGFTIPTYSQEDYQNKKDWHKKNIKWLEKNITGSAKVTYGSSFGPGLNPYYGKVGSVPYPSKGATYHMANAGLPFAIKVADFWTPS